MTILSDFKTKIGYTLTDKDQYFIDQYIYPAIQQINKNIYFLENITIQLSDSTYEYDLSVVADPVIPDGIEEIVFRDIYDDIGYRLNIDYFIIGMNKLKFNRPSSEKIKLTVNKYFKKPTTSTDGNIFKDLIVDLINFASAKYSYDNLVGNSGNAGVESYREANLSIKYGSFSSRKSDYQNQMSTILKDIYNGKYGKGNQFLSSFQIF